jgi:two-component system, cell cycle sensor histidine kinase and response regulator CckA
LSPQPERSPDQCAAIARFADALPVAIWVGRAPSGECVYVNREFERILGLAPPDATRGNYVGPYGVHLPSGEVYPEDRMPYERVIAARAAVTVEDLVVHKHDGTRTYLRVFASPLFDDAGAIAYVVEAFIDKSAEVETERLRAEGERQLHAARRIESIGSLASGIAHDFNNMLAVVKLGAAQLRTEADEGERQALLDCVDDVTDSAARLTRSLLGFAGRGHGFVQRVPIGELAESIVELAHRTFDANLRVRAELDADAHTVVGDVAQVEQVLLNLLFNARDAIAGPGEIVVRTALCPVEPGAHGNLAAGTYVELTVTDTGAGVDPSVRERMFEPYVTTKSAGATKGTGLGLATVYGIVQGHKGLVELAQTGPDGTTMRVLLPASRERAEATRSAPPRPSVQGRGTVLVVDDEPLVLRLTAGSLSALGYTVLSASSGEEALRVLRGRVDEIDAVVLDMVMPGMDGCDTYLAMRAVREGLPVILVTGNAMNAKAQDLIDLGVRRFLAKPYALSDLSAALAAEMAAPASA